MTAVHEPGIDAPLRVGLIAPPWVAVPPDRYGGTERVIDRLARGLVAAGCEVRLFTTGDSTCPVECRWLFPAALGTGRGSAAERTHVEAAYAALDDVDVIHDHTASGPDLVAADREWSGPPVVATMHGVVEPADRPRLAQVGRRVALVAISHAQRRLAPEVPVARVIHHGLDLRSVPVGSGDGGFLAFLGRMSPSKGVHRAIEIARASGRPLLIMAKMREAGERRYFDERVGPMLGDDAVYLGEIGGDRLFDLLGRAEALVNPIRWEEPFGLVMIEALACGTPVLATRRGAVPEIVDHGRTGFVADDGAELVAAVDRIGELSRTDCRVSALQRFSTERMVREHLELYRTLVRAGRS